MWSLTWNGLLHCQRWCKRRYTIILSKTLIKIMAIMTKGIKMFSSCHAAKSITILLHYNDCRDWPLHLNNVRVIHSHLLFLELRVSQPGVVCGSNRLNAISLHISLYFVIEVLFWQVYHGFSFYMPVAIMWP